MTGCANYKEYNYNDARISFNIDGKDIGAYLIEITRFDRDLPLILCNSQGVLLPFSEFTNKQMVSNFCSRVKAWCWCWEHDEAALLMESGEFYCVSCHKKMPSNGEQFIVGNHRTPGVEFYFSNDRLIKFSMFTSPYHMTSLGVGVLSDANPTGEVLFLHWPIPENEILLIFGSPNSMHSSLHL